MKRVSFLSQHLLQCLPLATLGVSVLFILSGCPQGAELEDPAKYGLTGGNSSMTGSGGSTGGSSAASGGMTGGSAGTGATLTVDCGTDTYQNVLSKNCANLAGCHKASTTIPTASMLNLTPDAGLVGRIKDVKALHGDITCSPDFAPCNPASCDPNALLVNSANPGASWILAKIKGNQADCGTQMPDIGGPPAAAETCLENFVAAVAALPK